MRNKSRFQQFAKRAVSAITALALFSGCLPLPEISDKLSMISTSLTVHAVEDYAKNPTLSSAQNFIDYSRAYREYPQNHQHDTITINRSNDLAETLFTGFLPLGTAEYPFAGTITFNSTSTHDINIDTAFFDYVYDHVVIDGGVDAGVERHITFKPTADNSSPVFANHVLKDPSATYGTGENQKTPATWKIDIDTYVPENAQTGTPHTHGSVIGEMGAGAECTLYINNHYAASVSNAFTIGSATVTDAGAVCGIMQAGSKLNVAKMSGSAMTSVTSASGNAGGLVGTMNAGSVLTISGASGDYVSPTSSITAAAGYAGGLVGSNDQATVTGSYTAIKNTVTGALGAGGLYGYYKPVMTSSAYSLTLNDFTIGDSATPCTVSSSGGAGGFFGVLENPGGAITLTGNSSKTIYAKSSGNGTVFGGIIGSYKANALADSLFVTGLSDSTTTSKLTVNTDKAGDPTYYGGAVGKIDGAYFASISDIDVAAANANDDFFGGAVACSDTGYVYVKDLKLTAASYRGGAIVGHTTSGVVHIAGTTDLSAATYDTGANYGQIVGFRDNALVFAESGWDLTRGAAVTADDIGSWGEVVRFKTSDFTIASVLESYYNPSSETPAHYATITGASFSDDKIALSSKSTFAAAALNLQLNGGEDSDVLRFSDKTNCAYDTLKTKSIVMTADIDLSHTGMTGLTRDNGSRVQYAGAEFDGGGKKLTLAIGEGYEGTDSTDVSSASGKGKIYQHCYNGLFGETSSEFTIKNVTLSGCVHTDDKAGESVNFYVGTAVGNAAAAFHASAVTVDSSTKITYATTGGKDVLYVGGLAGKLSDPGTSSIGSASYTGTVDSTFSAEITGSASAALVYVGGVCGYVGADCTLSVHDVKITGTVSNGTAKASQRVAGLFPSIADGTNALDLDGITLDGLTVKGKMNASSSSPAHLGGLLGYAWDGTDTTFDHISVTGCTISNDSTDGNMAGLVYCGSGHWIVNNVAVDGLTLGGNAAASFGMLVNKATSASKAMYLELPSGFIYTLKNVTGTAPAVYDELAASTKLADAIEANGNAVISINTTGTTIYGKQEDTSVHMTSGSCNTYQDQIKAFTTGNPGSRYYYNVDDHIGATNTGAAALYLWSVYQYAHSTIQSYIADEEPSAAFSGDLDLDGYSYYPVDVPGTVSISGTVGLHNQEIETLESASNGGSDAYTRSTLSGTQHYLMHAGLFRNVGGSIQVNGSLSISGTVPDTGTYCGALICGTVGGSASADAVVSSDSEGASIALAGIKVHNCDSTYSPLLINKASTNVVLDIYHVSASGYAAGAEIATSLIGNVGSATAEKIQVTFSDVMLDGRLPSNSTETGLTNVYNTSHSLFTRATLLESLTYAPGSGSFGTYNYEYTEDWGDTPAPRAVTYGKEISNADSVNFGKEFYYYKSFSYSQYFTNPAEDSATANRTTVYDFSGFRPYVAVWGTAIGNSSTKHQLDVNHSAATFGGCGTYNHPFTIAVSDTSANPDRSGGLLTIALILQNNIQSLGSNYTISLPDDITTPDTWCDDKTECAVYTFNSPDTFVHPTDPTKNKSLADVRKYLAGAYYYLATNIELGTGFEGLGNTSDADAVFHGVIAGNGRTITNKTASPLIFASSGCVVKNLTIKPDGIANSVSTSGAFDSTGGAFAYGALIGRVMGGDNIIDQVTVDTTTASVTAGNHLATIGSYVGVVVEGGVFFRDMDKVKNNVLFAGGAFAESDKGHLYCNPYIGRVISGFAVNETASDENAITYAPYENGTRTFGDGSTVTGKQVSLQNSNKNYSITDLDPDLTKLTVSGTTVTIPNSQAFFIMSLIINCGMGTDGTNVIGYYNTNQITRHAAYNNVGTDVKVSDFESTNAFNNSDARKDYLKTNSDTSASPYLLSAYASDSAKQLGSGSGFTLNVGDTIILPDGYKGIGNVFNNSESLSLALTTFNGNNKTISQNTTFYGYTSGNDNYLPYIQNTSEKNTIHGLGLFNYVNNATFQDCILTGNVKTRQCENGSDVAYVQQYDTTVLSAGMLTGTLNMTENATITDVYLKNVYTESSGNAAGMIGFLINGTKTITITNTATNKNDSDGIRVSAGTNAGGLISRQAAADAGSNTGDGYITIDLNNHHFDFVSIISRCSISSLDTSSSNTKWNQEWCLGVGGLVGPARGGNKTISISNVKIGSASDKTARVVACEYTDTSGKTQYGVLYVGGLVAIANRAPVTATNCQIFNVNVKTQKYAGGVLGWGGTESSVTFNNCAIENTLDAKIYSSGNDGRAGAVVGFCKTDMGNIFLKKSAINNYAIEGAYAGGVLGDWQANKEFSITDSVITNCSITYNNAGGGIAGQLKKNLYGYNVRVSGITFTPKNSSQQGYITGKRDGGIIKIVGFHRTGTISEAKLIGNKTNNNMTDMYGSGGYVIFADYEGKSAETAKNTTASGINLGNATRVNGFGASPYVTINPAITIDNNIGLITGDGMSSDAVNSILTDSSDNQYAVAGKADIGYFLDASDHVKTDIVSTFKTELGDTVTDADYDFPMLVINNTATADDVLNHYLRALTNTDNAVDFSYRNTNDQSGKLFINNQNNTNFGIVTIRKCNYSNGTITVSNKTNDASLLLNSSNVFQIRTTNNKEQYDTATPGQFTLIDIAFKDPSSTGNTAYHLYVPVIVKKLLEYNFDISAISGSTYDQTLYTGKRGNNVVENLGSPVTMEFEYTYLRTADEWTAEGDTNYSYDKYLSFDLVTTAAFDANTTRLVLVDVNNGGKPYYLDKWSDGYNSSTKLLDLQAFKDADGNSFSPVTFAQLLAKQQPTGDQTLKESYYLTIFTDPFQRPDTQAGQELVKVIHYSVTSPNIGTNDHPARRIDCTDQASDAYHYVTHLVIGDFYTNTVSVSTPSNAVERMSNSNKTITVSVSATVDLVNSGTRILLNDYLAKSNVTIYQSLLASFNKYNDSTLYDKGITAIDGYTITSYSITGTKGNIPITDQRIERSINFIEFQNNTDISNDLQTGAVASAVTATLSFNSENTQKAQFPYRSGNQVTGALVTGYSNISSSNANTAYSVVSASASDQSTKYYYVDSEESAELNYYVDYSGADKLNQLDAQLGINAREIEGTDTDSFIKTEGRYDATGLLSISDAKYLECSLKLYQKQNDDTYSEVDIEDYLDTVTVLAGKTPVYTNAATHTYVFNISDVPQFENEPNVYRIPVTFNALTGNQTDFKNTYQYANYKVVLTVSLFNRNESTDPVAWNARMDHATASSWVIYTNARIYTDLITANAS